MLVKYPGLSLVAVAGWPLPPRRGGVVCICEHDSGPAQPLRVCSTSSEVLPRL